MTVQTVQVAAGWVVMAATSDQVTIDDMSWDPASMHTSSRVRGRSDTFEGNVLVELRPFGAKTASVSTSAMGGANGTMAPYEAHLVPQPSFGVAVAAVPDASGRGTFVTAAVRRYAAADPDPASFDGTIDAQMPDGSYVTVTSGGDVPATAEDFSARRAALADPVAGAVDRFGSMPTYRRGSSVALVAADGVSVVDVDVLTGEVTPLFTAPHPITSLDANALGGLLFTDDQTGLWRWDGPGQGPVQLTTGYVDAAW